MVVAMTDEELLIGARYAWKDAKARHPNNEAAALAYLHRACVAKLGEGDAALKLATDAIYAGPLL